MRISRRNTLLLSFVSISIILILTFQENLEGVRLKVLNFLKTPLFLIAKTVHTARNFSEFINLKEENQILKSENEALKLQLLKIKEAAIENQRLKGLLDFKIDKRNKFLPALVIGKEAVSWRASIVINRGRRDGVRTGSTILKGECLVGRITEVGPTISRAVLITDPDSGVSALIQKSRIEGVVSGVPGGRLIMKYLPLDAQINKGDVVITSGLGGVFEKGFLVGEVIGGKKDPSGLFYNAELKPAADLERLEEVLIIK